jgi:hypothetical protein
MLSARVFKSLVLRNAGYEFYVEREVRLMKFGTELETRETIKS